MQNISFQHNNKILCIGKLVFLCRLCYFGLYDIEKYVEGSINDFPRIQLGCQNSIFVIVVIVTVNEQVRKGARGLCVTHTSSNH